MSIGSPVPEWYRWDEVDLEALTSEQVREVEAYWDARAARHRLTATELSEDDVHGRRYQNYSAWWCSKHASMALRVLLRRE